MRASKVATLLCTSRIGLVIGVHACSNALPVVVVTCEAPLGLLVIFSLLRTSFLLLCKQPILAICPPAPLPYFSSAVQLLLPWVMVIVFFVLVFLLCQMCHCNGQQSLPFSCFSVPASAPHLCV